MEHLIDKDAIVAEIERLMTPECGYSMNKLLDYINNLEVKEVDDEPECKIFPRPAECDSTCKECPWSAASNKAQKGEEV